LDRLIRISGSEKDKQVYTASYQDKKEYSRYCPEIVKRIIGRREIPVCPVFNIKEYLPP